VPETRKKKSTPRKKTKSSGKKGGQAARKGSRQGRLLWRALGVLLVAVVAYFWYLDRLIENRFDGETWARPSRVFARPLELYRGLNMDAATLRRELDLSTYQHVDTLAQPGQFALRDEGIDIWLREFAFPDRQQDAQQIEVRFRNGAISRLYSIDQQTGIDFIQMTPALIGSYLPGNGEDRLVVERDEIPQALVDVLLAVEDRRFYEHRGINPLSIGRALVANVRAGKTVQGGSTLTQQLAKNLFLTPERSLLRKINEAFLALMLEMRFDKDTLLTAYINEVFLLQQNNVAIHGFALASRMLFKQSLRQLELDKLAMLVGMVKGPSRYNPIQHPQATIERRNQVIDVMLKTGLIDRQQHQDLVARGLNVVDRLPPVNPYPAYVDLVKKQLTRNYSSADLSRKGLRIFSNFDPVRQHALEQGLASGLARFDQNAMQAAVVVADYLSGDLLAMVGDRDTDFPGYNRAILAQRPIGSLIKPLLLYTLLEDSNSLATLIEDRPVRVQQSNGEIWSPNNYDRKLHGEITLYQSFVNSYNLPFVRLGLENDRLQTLSEHLHKLGLLKQSVVYPSLLLGAMTLTPFEVAQLYQVIANTGYFSPLTTIRQVTDAKKRVLTRIPLSSEAMFNRQTMIQVQRAMIGVTEEGTAKYLKQHFEKRSWAGKTGTTNDLRDSWFAGFGNRYLAVVWLGDDDNRPIELSGSSGALRVWADIMQRIDDRSLKLGIDPGLQWRHVHRIKGGKVPESCQDAVLLPFVEGRIPDNDSQCDSNLLKEGLDWLQQNL
jgi:penicillin-binding protein 1B